MGYRIDRKPVKPENVLPVYPVRNGATLYADFECYYVEPIKGHDPRLHDHVGWPDPHHPGAACQMLPPRTHARWLDNPVMLEYNEPEKIMLTEEGYDSEATVAFDDADAAEYISAEAYIDDELDYLIHLVIAPNFPVFEDKPKDLRFTLFIKRTDNGTDYYDAVARIMLSVLPGAPHPDVM